MTDLTDKEIQEWKDKIDKMSRIEMAELRRFAEVGHPVFDSRYPLYDHFTERFDRLGGMSPQISKSIGWKP